MENENILELTEANLIKCGLDAKHFNRTSHGDPEINCGDFIVSYTDNKIYPIISKYIQSYNGNETPIFPLKALDLIQDYYNCKLNIYLKQRENLLGRSFVKLAETNLFKQSEIKQCEQVINHYSDLFRTKPHILDGHSAVIGKQAYKTLLENAGVDSDKPKAEKRLSAKYYSLLHKIKISLGIGMDFKLTSKGLNDKPTIIKYAIDNYGFKDGQPFYRAFTNPEDLNDKKSIVHYGKDYKQKLIKLSDNNHRIIEELKKYPN